MEWRILPQITQLLKISQGNVINNFMLINLTSPKNTNYQNYQLRWNNLNSPITIKKTELESQKRNPQVQIVFGEFYQILKKRINTYSVKKKKKKTTDPCKSLDEF